MAKKKSNNSVPQKLRAGGAGTVANILSDELAVCRSLVHALAIVLICGALVLVVGLPLVLLSKWDGKLWGTQNTSEQPASTTFSSPPQAQQFRVESLRI